MGSGRLVRVLLGMTLFTCAALAQTTGGTVSGAVSDPSGANVDAAAVTALNVDTGVTTSTLTNSSGVYVFPGVFPGPYRITAESPGMQKYEGNLTVQAQQDASIDVVLQVGQTATQV